MTVWSVMMTIALCGSIMAEDNVQVPNRMAVSEIGEWVSFNLPDGYVQKHTVVKREGVGAEAQVTIRVDNIYDGEVVNSDYIVEDAGEPVTEVSPSEDAGVAFTCRPDAFMLKGKEYQGVALEVTRDGKPYQVWYISADIPVYGLGKRTSADNTSGFEIGDFGMN